MSGIWEDNIKMHLRKMDYEEERWIKLVQDRVE
jgi:hypothetical protein